MIRLAAIPGDVITVLAAITYLLVKHLFADFLLQTEHQRLTKGIYGASGGLTHALTHAVLTAPVFLILAPIGALVITALLFSEFVLHYHIDWTKEQFLRHNQWTPKHYAFWWALGIDQLAHGLTYIALIWLAFSFSIGGLPD